MHQEQLPGRAHAPLPHNASDFRLVFQQLVGGLHQHQWGGHIPRLGPRYLHSHLKARFIFIIADSLATRDNNRYTQLP